MSFNDIYERFKEAKRFWPTYALELGNTDGYPITKLAGTYYRPQDLPAEKNPFDRNIRIYKDTRLPEVKRWQGPTSDAQWIGLDYIQKTLNYSKLDETLKSVITNKEDNI